MPSTVTAAITPVAGTNGGTITLRACIVIKSGENNLIN